MKAVLISIQPKWCELIASGKKTIEVRKTRPKLETPFKVYIYCTQGDALAAPSLNVPRYAIHRTNNGTAKGRRMTIAEMEQSDHLYANGKIIGEFICRGVEKFVANYKTAHIIQTEQLARSACIPMDKLVEYGCKSFHLYAWHISDLVMYEKPKELSEFWLYNDELHKRFDNDEDYCAWGNCETENENANDCDGENIMNCYECWRDWSGWCHKVKSPPQSWCYVEEISQMRNGGARCD